MDGESKTDQDWLITLVSESEPTSPTRTDGPQSRVIEYKSLKACSFIGDGVIRIIPKEGPIFSLALSDKMIALLVEDGAKYLREKLVDGKR